MPQPALHLFIADITLRRWRDLPHLAPFDIADDDARNAFHHGCLGPDYGLFPGGDATLAALSHTGRTGALLRNLLDRAVTPAQRAFAYGWLTHTLADVAIHPLINSAATDLAGAGHSLADHIRVEVGVDVHFVWQNPTLQALRLRPAFDRDSFAFFADAVRSTHGHNVTTAQLVQMQRGMLHFIPAALRFTTSVARDLCWEDRKVTDYGKPVTAALWRLLTAVSSRRSTVHAWLNPIRPAAWLAADVAAALVALQYSIDRNVVTRLLALPDYDLETGGVTTHVDSERVA